MKIDLSTCIGKQTGPETDFEPRLTSQLQQPIDRRHDSFSLLLIEK